MTRLALILALLVSLLCAQSASANLVTNGGFETGDFTEWTPSGNQDYTAVWATYGNSGNYGAAFGPIGSLGFISQNLDTNPGTYYYISFYLGSGSSLESDNTPNEIQVSWGGAIISDIFDLPNQGYTLYNFVALATDFQTELKLGLRNDPDYQYLDDVSVNAVPLPGAAILLGSGLLGLVGWRRFRKN